MAAKVEPRSGLNYGWALGEQNWNTGMDANMLNLGRFGFHLSVKNRTVTDPTTLAPVAGDTYIVAAAATGTWAGKDGQVAIYDGAAWQFGVPRTGWLAYIEDESVLSIRKAGAWSAGVTI